MPKYQVTPYNRRGVANLGRDLFRAAQQVRPYAKRAYQAYKSRPTHRSVGTQTPRWSRSNAGTGMGHQGSDTTYSSCHRRFKKRVSKGFRKIVAPQRLNAVVDTVHDGVKNEQSAVMLNAFVAPNGAQTPWICSGSTNGDTTTMQQIMALTEDVYGSTALLRRYMVDNVSVRFRIKNQHNFPIKITLYDISPRKDQTLIRDPIGDWEAGIDRQAVPVVGPAVSSIDRRFPGTTPFSSPYFTEYNKVLRVTTIMIHPGSEHHHVISVRPGGMFNAAFTDNTQGFRGLTMGCMMVMTGGLGTGATATTEAAYSSGKTAVIAEYRSKYLLWEKSRPVMTLLNGLYNDLPLDAVRSVLEDADTVATEADA